MELRTQTIRINDIAKYPKSVCHKLCTEPMCRLTVIFGRGVKYPENYPSTSKYGEYAMLFSRPDSNVVAVVVEEGATVPEYAFFKCKRLETVMVGSGASIYAHAFQGCTNLMSVKLNEFKCGPQLFDEAQIQMLHLSPAAIFNFGQQGFEIFSETAVNLLLIDNGEDDKFVMTCVGDYQTTYMAVLEKLFGEEKPFGEKKVGACIFCTPFREDPQVFNKIGNGSFTPIVSYAFRMPDAHCVCARTETIHQRSQDDCPIDWEISLFDLGGTEYNVRLGNGVQQWIDAIKHSCLFPAFPVSEKIEYWVAQCNEKICAYYQEQKTCGLRAKAKDQHPSQLGDGRWTLVVPEDLEPIEDHRSATLLNASRDAVVKAAFEDKDEVVDVTAEQLYDLLLWTKWDACLQLHYLEEPPRKRLKDSSAFVDLG